MPSNHKLPQLLALPLAIASLISAYASPALAQNKMLTVRTTAYNYQPSVSIVHTYYLLTSAGLIKRDNYSNGAINDTVVSAVARVAYSSTNQKTIFFTNNTSITINASRSSLITIGNQTYTRYTYEDGSTRDVLSSNNGGNNGGGGNNNSGNTNSNPTYTAAVYPADWASNPYATVKAPSTSPKIVNGVVLEDGTASKPFTQTTLQAASISDPNAIVKSNSTTYNLSWGTPDKNGPSYAAQFSNIRSAPSGSGEMLVALPSKTYWGKQATNLFVNVRSDDVINAWKQGWTGKGVNILIDDTGDHGIHTMLITDVIAPGATKYGSLWGTFGDPKYSNDPKTRGLFDINGNSTQAPTKMHVVSMSWGNPVATYTNEANSLSPQMNQAHLSDAVFVKAAGNSSMQTNLEGTSRSMAYDPTINQRLIIVGALNKNGTTTAPATIQGYSNTAGYDANIADRFLVAADNTGVVSADLNGAPTYRMNGTSAATPTVAGYAAILRQKFANINAAQTASILLDTARYDTLTCNTAPGGCDKAIYGRGEASLSRALSPVGKLR